MVFTIRITPLTGAEVLAIWFMVRLPAFQEITINTPNNFYVDVPSENSLTIPRLAGSSNLLFPIVLCSGHSGPTWPESGSLGLQSYIARNIHTYF